MSVPSHKSTTFALGLAPISSEIIEAAFRYSDTHNVGLMLVASKNQIDYSGGYVNRWTTQAYIEYVKKMMVTYPRARIRICRDHCGPGFNGTWDIEDVNATIDEDIKCGFDLIHIDFTQFRGSEVSRRSAAKHAIERCLDQNPNILIEIGGHRGVLSPDQSDSYTEFEEGVSFFTEFCTPEFVVLNTGSEIEGMSQKGSFNEVFISKAVRSLKQKRLKSKEHNADYLSLEQLKLRRRQVNAVNIAPQLGVIQTQTTLAKCTSYGISPDPFLSEVHQGGMWKKWTRGEHRLNKTYCSTIAGHYHFSSPEYAKIIKEISKHEDLQETIVDAVSQVIHSYITAVAGDIRHLDKLPNDMVFSLVNEHIE